MTKLEKNRILCDIATMSDKTLIEKTVNAIFDSIGSQVPAMYDKGYDIVDIKERESYEQYLFDKANIYTRCCTIRGIDLGLYL